MSSEPRPQPDRAPRRRRAGDPAGPGEGAGELGRAHGYDPDDPATWPGNAPDNPAGTAAAEPGDDDLTLTDATAMRALAHPVRMAILELLNFRQTLTATQASEALGESPANCAFHLRTLAKYGYLREAGGGRGRERPWALANRRMTLITSQLDPQAALAAGELGRIFLERWIDRAMRVYGSPDQLPGWDEASGWSSSHVFLTPAETTRLRNDVRRMLERYEDRLTNPALRPEGSLPVEWTVFAFPVPELAEPAERAAAAGQEDPGAGRPAGRDATGRR